MQKDDVVAGRYVLDRQIGEGGFGRVWVATDIPTGDEVAIKQLMRLLAQPSAQQRKADVRVAMEANATSPSPARRGRVRVREIVKHDSLYCLVMDYVEGRTLADVLTRHRPLKVKAAIAVAVQLLDALISVHEEQLVHRDVKPDNVMINDQGEVLLIDFGIVTSTASGAERLTEIGFGVGTIGYMPPEQARGHPVYQSDLYAVGVLIYEMLAGEHPFSDDNDWGLADGRTYERLSSKVTNVPLSLDLVVHWSLAPDPDDRPQSAAVMRELLVSHLPKAGEPADRQGPRPDPTVPFREPSTAG